LDPIRLREWEAGDLPLLQAELGDPVTTKYLGGPETREQLTARHIRYLALEGNGTGHMLVILAGLEEVAVGSVGYWDSLWHEEPIYEMGWGVLPAFQGRGIATGATTLALAHAGAEGKHRFVHAFPSIDNAASNAICRKAGFTLLEEGDFEYPKGHWMRCNDWVFDLRDLT
jgi:RimJ/RimL family protein N-acetyltransferase